MIAYSTIGVDDMARAVAFYDGAFAPLGAKRDTTSDTWTGHSRAGDRAKFFLTRPFDRQAAAGGNGAILALLGEDRASIDRFHAAALEHGGICEGPPGVREGMNPVFYAASVRDPDGNKLCAVKDWTEDDFIYGYYWEWTFPQTPTTFAIQRGRLKYIQYHGVWDLEELYDLSQDPEEMNNLIHDKAYAAARIELRHALFKGLATNTGRHAVPYTEKSSAGLGLRDREGDKAADFPSEWQVTTTKPDPAK